MTTETKLRRLADSVGTHTTLDDWREIHGVFNAAMIEADRHHRVVIDMFVDANHKYLKSR